MMETKEKDRVVEPVVMRKKEWWNRKVRMMETKRESGGKGGKNDGDKRERPSGGKRGENDERQTRRGLTEKGSEQDRKKKMAAERQNRVVREMRDKSPCLVLYLSCSIG
ncbi:hypothetical protein [Thiolapillus sp.]|uniref:hypothetical protein n=1 Tax=Thiolapillus sp. TaxID=2017437 RepID=UPI0025F27FCA|nr:hypothetical protein [Thiolapillus sp.]